MRIWIGNKLGHIFLLLALFTPSVVSADAIDCSNPGSGIKGIIVKTSCLFQDIVVLLIFIAIAAFIWGVVKFIANADNPEKIKKAKGIMIWGIVGLAVIASIAGIIALTQGYFGITGSEVIKIPKVPK